MTGVSELFGWFVFNVAIPLLAPFALLPFAKVPVFSRSRSQGIVRRAIQDGQLLWAAIPLNASACYGLVRIPRDGGHDSTLMADSVPASSRTPFHGDGGQHSIWMADT